jgi:hypothetical protein
MIKNIKDFPRLDAIQQYENCKETIRLCDETIQGIEDYIERLRLELYYTPFEFEQLQIVDGIVACSVQLSACESSKKMVENKLKHLAPLFN